MKEYNSFTVYEHFISRKLFSIKILSRGFQSLKTEIERISDYIHQMHGMHSFFQN